MIDNAQYVYAEYLQLTDIARQHKINCEFWKLAEEALKDEKPEFLDSMWDYRMKMYDIRRKLKRNQRMYKQTCRRVEQLKRRYKLLRELKGETKNDER